MWPLAVTFGSALALCWGLTHLAIAAGRHFRILDYPDNDRKLHARATPRTGGMAVCTTLLVGASVLSCFVPDWGTGAPNEFTAFLSLSTALLCVLGLWDDKMGMRARTKLLWQIVAILPFVCWGRASSSVDLLGWHIETPAITVPLILFWLVSCTNFVNLMDGLDGLASTVGLIIALAVAALASLCQLHEVSLLATVLGGALLGFLLHNWPPARIFLGDSGSLPLGFLVGALSLEASAKKTAGLTLAVPFVLLTIPMFDTSMAILRRKLNGKKIGQGDRAHIHHCLRDRGLTPTQTLLAIAGLCGATAIAAIISTALNSNLVALATCGGLLGCLVAGRVFGFNETVLLARHFRAIGSFLRGAPRALRARFVVVRLEPSVAAGRLDLWHKIIIRARRLAGVEIEFVCEHQPSGRERVVLAWVSASPPANMAPKWRVAYSVPRENGFCTRAEATGELAAEGGLPYHELAEMLAALCRHWPVDFASLEGPGDTRDQAVGGPQILSPHWSTTRVREQGAYPFDPIENDAA